MAKDNLKPFTMVADCGRDLKGLGGKQTVHLRALKGSKLGPASKGRRLSAAERLAVEEQLRISENSASQIEGRPKMFDAISAHKDLVLAISQLTVWRRGNQASVSELEGTAEHLKQLGKLVADYTESVMADCAASVSVDAIAESDANFIWQAADDCAGQLLEAAHRVQEAA